jgi:hypothetical protein
MDLKFVEHPIRELNAASVMKLLQSPTKVEEAILAELKELYFQTKNISHSTLVYRKDLLEHDLFKIMNGNALCALLVSSLISGKLLIYRNFIVCRLFCVRCVQISTTNGFG